MTFDGKYIAQIGWTLIYIINTYLNAKIMKFTQKYTKFKISEFRISLLILCRNEK